MTWHVIDPDQLSEVSLFATLAHHELVRIAGLVTVVRYRKNERVVSEGESADRIFIIRSGAVRVSRAIPGVGEEALAILSAGSYFGEMALFGGAPTRSADVIADGSTVVYSLYVDELRALLDADEALAVRFLWSVSKTLAERLRESNAKVMFLAAAGVFGG